MVLIAWLKLKGWFYHWYKPWTWLLSSSLLIVRHKKNSPHFCSWNVIQEDLSLEQFYWRVWHLICSSSDIINWTPLNETGLVCVSLLARQAAKLDNTLTGGSHLVYGQFGQISQDWQTGQQDNNTPAGLSIEAQHSQWEASSYQPSASNWTRAGPLWSCVNKLTALVISKIFQIGY